MKKKVLISQARLTQETELYRILNYIKQQVPKLYVDIDLEEGKVAGLSKPPLRGLYSDIPPLFLNISKNQIIYVYENDESCNYFPDYIYTKV